MRRASAISAWPMLTSSSHGICRFRNARFWSERSWPALRPSPTLRAISLNKWAHSLEGVLRIELCEWFRIEFHAVCPNAARCLSLTRVGIYEYRNSATRSLQSRYYIGKKPCVGSNVPTMVRRQLFGRVGNESDLVGTHVLNHLEKCLCGISLNVELPTYYRTKCIDIVPAYMPLIRTRMHRYTIGSKQFTKPRSLHYIGVVAASRIAQPSHLVYVDT